MKLQHNLFVSSTFQDMHAERDLLHNEVVPALMERFSRYHIRLDMVDLRWGVDTPDDRSEQENTFKILQVCFDEIDRSYPFFLGLIGERYGWIPNAQVIENAVLGYEFEWRGQNKDSSMTELEMQYALQRFTDEDHCLFFLRNGLSPEDMDDPHIRSVYFPEDPVQKERCDRLKCFLRQERPKDVFEYTCSWDRERNTVVGLEGLRNTLIAELGRIIEQDLGQEHDRTVHDPFGEQVALQQAVLQDLQQNVYGREAELGHLWHFVTDPSVQKKEMAVVAPSGLGKSSLMAAFCQRLSEQGIRTIPFFAGINEQSQRFSFLAEYCYGSLNPEKRAALSAMDYGELKKQLLSELTDAVQKGPVVILVDALDQFDPCRQLDELDWIHDQIIPKGVKVIYSCLPDLEYVFRHRSADIYRLEALELSAVRMAATGIARSMHKELSEQTLSLLEQKTSSDQRPACCVPIYLVSLLELLCSFDFDDFTRIAEQESNSNLTPAQAIQSYIAQTIRSVGGELSDLLSALTAKGAGQLGRKFHMITALMTESPYGITEAEITGITAGLGIAVTAADFSLYRRIFRMHLQQRQDGSWYFTHAVFRRELTPQLSPSEQGALWTAAAEYYEGLAPTHPHKYTGIFRYRGKLQDYSAIAHRCCEEHAESGGSELLSLMLRTLDVQTDSHVILNHCSLQECRCLCRILSSFVQENQLSDGERLIALCVCCITALSRYVRESLDLIELLSEFYYKCGALLLHTNHAYAHDFLEISLHILGKDPKISARALAHHALRIGRAYAERHCSAQSESYVKLALRYAEDHCKVDPCAESRRLLAECCLERGKCAMAHPLRINYFRTNRELLRAAKLASETEQWELALQAALLFLQTPRIFQTSKKRAFMLHLLEEADMEHISEGCYVQLQMFLAERSAEGALERYASAYQGAVHGLARDHSNDAMILYEKVTERYGYELMLAAADGDQIGEVFEKADHACRKLDLVTNDMMWNERRIAMLGDIRAYQAVYDLTYETEAVLQSTSERTDRALKNKKDLSGDHRSIYISLMKKCIPIVVLLVFVASFFTQNMMKSLADGNILRSLSSFLLDVSETVVNLFVTLAMALFVLLIRCMDKRSFRYKANLASMTKWILAVFGALVVSLILLFANLLYIVTPYNIDRYYGGIFYIFGASMVFSASITWFVGWIAGVLADRKDGFAAKRQVRYRYRRQELLKGHLWAWLFTLCNVLFFLPALWMDNLDHGITFIDYFHTPATVFACFSWVLPLVQLLLSLIELGRLRGKAKPAEADPKQVRSPRFKPTAPALSLVLGGMLVVGMILIGRPIVGALQYKNYGYYVEDGLYYQINEDQTLRVVQYRGTEEQMVIPATYRGMQVTVIGDGVFEGYTRLRSVELPDSLRHIGNQAFGSCIRLQSVNLPKQLESIGDHAFQGCASLAEVTVPDYEKISVGKQIFEETGLWQSEQVQESGYLRIGDTLAYWDPYYYGALHLENIRVIPDFAFYEAPWITEVHLGIGVKEIGSQAFANCSGLYYVSLPSTLEEISGKAFENCTKLLLIDNRSDMELKAGEAYNDLQVDNHAIMISVDQTVLPERTEAGELFIRHSSRDGSKWMLISVNEEAECLSLPEAYQGERYTISDSLFTTRARCVSLVIPDSVANEAQRERIRKLNGLCETPSTEEERRILTDEQGVVYAYSQGTEGTVEIYGYGGDGPNVTLDFPNADSILLTDYAFAYDEQMESITVRQDATVGEGAFFRSQSLRTIVFEGDVAMEDEAFYNAEGLEAVTVQGRATMGMQAFTYCLSLTDFSVGEVSDIPWRCFEGCYSLQTVGLGQGLQTLEHHAFYLCDSVEEIYYEGSATSWAKISMDGIYSNPLALADNARLIINGELLEHAVFDETLEEVAYGSFYHYKHLKSVCFEGEGVTVGTKAFEQCTDLEQITRLSAVVEIGQDAFAGCAKLKQLDFGEELHSIGSNAFRDCEGLTFVYVPAVVTDLGQTIFEGCKNIQTIELADIWRGNTQTRLGESIHPKIVFYSVHEAQPFSQ